MHLINALIYSRHPVVRLLRHILFWTADVGSYLSVISINKEINTTEILNILLRLVPVIITTYFILYYLIPNYSKLKDSRLILWILAVLLFLGVGMRYYIYYFVNPLLSIIPSTPYKVLDFRLVINQVFSHMSVICMAVTIRLVKNKIELGQSNEQLQNEKRTAELNFLKAQMQPHFLFNTLNTLYSETIHETGKAQQVVLHLSSLMRFILDECNKPLISISKEILVIQDFIALEKLRHGDRLNVSTEIDIDDQSALISPLIFLPFVENSFKHTLDSQRGVINIHIELKLDGNHFNLSVENDRVSERGKVNGYSPGKGIINTRRQLDLIYGKDYSLNINGTEKTYRVALKVPVKSNANV
jgi:two-component system, LytTR family, sensor kinase